jgi:hypothetical protein
MSKLTSVTHWLILDTSYPLSMVVFPTGTAAANSNVVLLVRSASASNAALASCNDQLTYVKVKPQRTTTVEIS